MKGFIHNVFAHPAMGILCLTGTVLCLLGKASIKLGEVIHENTIPKEWY